MHPCYECIACMRTMYAFMSTTTCGGTVCGGISPYPASTCLVLARCVSGMNLRLAPPKLGMYLSGAHTEYACARMCVYASALGITMYAMNVMHATRACILCLGGRALLRMHGRSATRLCTCTAHPHSARATSMPWEEGVLPRNTLARGSVLVGGSAGRASTHTCTRARNCPVLALTRVSAVSP